jgi:hypothetical protein
VHIVHREDNRATFGPALQILAQHAQQVHLVDLVQVAGKKLSQRTEGKRPHRFRSVNPFDVVARRRTQDLVDQARFPNSGLASQQNARSTRVRNGVRYEALFFGPPDHRPPVHGS